MGADQPDGIDGERCEPIDRRTLLRAAAASLALTALGPTSLDAFGASTPRGADDAYLDAARKAERWIARSAIHDARGITWPADPLDLKTVQNNLYSGSPGVLLFYLELHRVTGDAAYLETARRAADYLVATLPARGAPLREEDAGLYTGIAGIAYALSLTADATREAKYAHAVRDIGMLLREGLTPRGGGAAWNDSNDIISGSSGVLLALLWLEQRDPAWREWRDAERQVVRALIDHGIAEKGGLKWGAGPALPHRYPNFSHGTSGVGYALATFAERDAGSAVAKDALDAALAGATYLDAIATRMPDGGRKIFHDEPGGEQLFYLSWCHGPAGTARFYQRLAVVTRERRWAAYVPQLAQGIVGSGVPEHHPDRSGYWNNISQCCGNCGVAEFFLALHVARRDPSHLAFARRVMDDALARATADADGFKWIQAENRVSPLDVVAQTGLMQGAAGVGLALLHLDGALRGRAPLVVLPDAIAFG